MINCICFHTEKPQISRFLENFQKPPGGPSKLSGDSCETNLIFGFLSGDA